MLTVVGGGGRDATMTNRCDGCRFWVMHGEDGVWPVSEDNPAPTGYQPDDFSGDCRRYPPTVDFVPLIGLAMQWVKDTNQPVDDANLGQRVQESTWPLTTADDWCGEWQAKEHTKDNP